MNTEEAADEALERADRGVERIDQWRTQLRRLATDSLPGMEETSFLGRELRAASVVAAMAELEALLRDLLLSVSKVINGSGLAIKDLIPPLRPLAAHARFESLINTSNTVMSWDRRIELSQLNILADSASLPVATTKAPPPPLDGSTIQLSHISLVWKVLGMGDPIPDASIVGSLKKLSSLRNDVAHRNQEIGEVFSNAGRTAMDLSNYMEDMVLLFTNIGVQWSDYLRDQGFKQM